MGCADNPSSQEQVRDIPTVEAPVRNGVNPPGMPLLATRFLAENPVAGMQIHSPAAIAYRIRESMAFHNILLSEDIIPFETAALPFARDLTDPLEGQRLGFWEQA